jgi:hypothetical protein
MAIFVAPRDAPGALDCYRSLHRHLGNELGKWSNATMSRASVGKRFPRIVYLMKTEFEIDHVPAQCHLFEVGSDHIERTLHSFCCNI